MVTKYKIKSEQDISDIKNAIANTKPNIKHTNRELTYNLLLDKDQTNANLLFTPEAFLKMYALVDQIGQQEIAWQGLTSRLSANEYLVDDIVMFPQRVTESTVTTDEVEYTNEFLMKLTDDQINNLKFHGHSHVNFGVFSSGTDDEMQNNQLETLTEDDDFYIFMIVNKKREYVVWIYDLANNKVYDKDSINLKIVLSNESTTVEEWANAQIKNCIKISAPSTIIEQPSEHYKTYAQETSFEALLQRFKGE